MDGQFTRGQVNWLLASYFKGRAGASVPATFVNRIKRLLDIDRRLKIISRLSPEAAYAFFEKKPRGSGHETYFSEFHVFYMAVGLHLLDAGFKQEEIVWLLREAKSGFFQEFERLTGLGYPAADVGVYPGGTLSGASQRKDGYDDPTVYAVIQTVQFKELWSVADWRAKAPFIIRPQFFRGFESLRNILADKMPMNFHNCHLIEIATIANRINTFSKAVPSIQRGRPQGS